MTLIVEDGTGVANANSFATADEVRAYCSNRKLSIPVDTPSIEEFLIIGTDYLETMRKSFKGSLTHATQVLAWPRTDVLVDVTTDGSEIVLGAEVIPGQLKAALSMLVVEQHAGTILFPKPLTPSDQAGTFLSEDTVGPIVSKWTEYEKGDMSGHGSSKPIVISSVQAALALLLLNYANVPGSIRV